MDDREPSLPIRLATVTFDPLREQPKLPDELRIDEAQPGPARFIVQFRKSLTPEERARLQTEYGLRLTEYIPEFAYLEAISAETLAALSREPLFRASVPYQPAFKFAPTLGKSRTVRRSGEGGRRSG